MNCFVDELDLSREYSDLFQIQGEACKKVFEKRHVSTYLAMGGANSVKEYIRQFIKERPYIHNIAFSDGVTLYKLDIFNFIHSEFREFDINQPLARGKTGHYEVFGDQPEGRMNLPFEEWKKKNELWEENCRRSLTSDLLIISANAITVKGEIISIDGLGNRVTGMMFGPKHVICIVGRNKIYPDSDTALSMIRHRVVPLTYLRHINKHSASFQEVPCLKVGHCIDCMHEYSSCRDVVIMRGQIKQHKDRLHLIIVNEDLGF